MAMLLQYMSGKIGIATGRSMSEIVREKLATRPRIISYWLACETFAVATDLAEFLGVTIGLHLLFRVPLNISVWIAAFDVIVIFLLAGNKFRRIEFIVATLVAVIGLGYVYEIFVTGPDPRAILLHSVVPMMPDSRAMLVSVGIIGATVMPHALVLHSWLTKNKLVTGDVLEKRTLLRYHKIENVINLTIAGLINGAILMMAAAAFSGLPTNVDTVELAYTTLVPFFGFAAGAVFAITLIASGISSSTTGVLAGQSLFEGLLGTRVNPWFRRIVIRGINVIPTAVAINLGLNPLGLLVYSQVILSLLIPLPLVPVILFTRDRRLMGEFVNRRATTLVALGFAGVILFFNGFLLLRLATG